MSKKSDDSVEQFFRKAVSQQDTSHIDKDWADMEKLLDADTPVAGNGGAIRGKMMAGVIVLLLVSSVVLWYVLSGSSIGEIQQQSSGVQVTQPEASGQPQQAENRSAETNQAGEDQGTSIKPQNDIKRLAAGAGPQQVVPSVEPSAGPLSSSEKENRLTAKGRLAAVEQLSVSPIENQRSSRTSQAEDLASQKNVATHAPVLETTATQTSSFGEQTTESSLSANITRTSDDQTGLTHGVMANASASPTSSDVHRNELQTAANETLLQSRTTASNEGEEGHIAPDSTATTVIAEEKEAEQEKPQEETPAEEEKEDEQLRPGKLSVIVSVAPDFSTTKIGRYDAPGLTYGFAVAFRPFNRWQIATGLYKASKKYEGYGDEYKPPTGYWQRRTNGVVPDEIYGSCGIIEWPVMVRYDAFILKRSLVFASLGVSSYHMSREKYEYTFFEENPGAVSGWEASKSTDYNFSVGHVSVGYEHMINSHFSVLVEPYLKVPFGGIGWSNINLYTTGAYISVRYAIIPHCSGNSKTKQPLFR